jgi:hypothetical protein
MYDSVECRLDAWAYSHVRRSVEDFGHWKVTKTSTLGPSKRASGSGRHPCFSRRQLIRR